MAKRSFAEAVIQHDQAVKIIDDRLDDQDSELDEAEHTRMRKALDRELKDVEKSVAPARAAPRDGTKAKQIGDMKINKFTYYVAEPCAGPYATCSFARTVLFNTCGAWLSAKSGARGGGNGAVQSYHVKDLDATAGCKIKMTDDDGAYIYWYTEATAAAPDTWAARPSAAVGT